MSAWEKPSQLQQCLNTYLSTNPSTSSLDLIIDENQDKVDDYNDVDNDYGYEQITGDNVTWRNYKRYVSIALSWWTHDF